MVRAAVLALVAIVAAGPMVPTVDAQTTEAVAIIVHPLVAEDNYFLHRLICQCRFSGSIQWIEGNIYVRGFCDLHTFSFYFFIQGEKP